MSYKHFIKMKEKEEKLQDFFRYLKKCILVKNLTGDIGHPVNSFLPERLLKCNQQENFFTNRR